MQFRLKIDNNNNWKDQPRVNMQIKYIVSTNNEIIMLNSDQF